MSCGCSGRYAWLSPSSLFQFCFIYAILASMCFECVGHVNNRHCIFNAFFGPEGRWVVSGSENHSVCVWDLQTQKMVQRLPDHADTVSHHIRRLFPIDAHSSTLLSHLGAQVLAIGVHPTLPRFATSTMGPSPTIHIWEALAVGN